MQNSRDRFPQGNSEQIDDHEQLNSDSFSVRHDEAKASVVRKLDLDPNSTEAEEATGDFLVARVENDIVESVDSLTTELDTGAALISGVDQVSIANQSSEENSGDNSNTSLNISDISPANPISILESEHPDLVTDTVREMATQESSSKYALMAAKIIDKIKTLKDKMTPTLIVEDATIISRHSAKQFEEFQNNVSEARLKNSSDPLVNIKHRSPTVKQFKKWKKTGKVDLGIGLDSLGPVEQEFPAEAHSLSGSKDYVAPELATSSIVELHPALATEDISQEDAVRRLEKEGVVRLAPRLSEQLLDEIRSETKITYIGEQTIDLRTRTSLNEHRSKRVELSESESLQELDAFLEKAALQLEEPWSEQARSIRDNITFIGEKEYKEATAGIAASWKAALDDNPSLQIYAIAGEIAKSGGYNDAEGETQIKSDEYLLDNILSNFDEEDWVKYGDRIALEEAGITAKDKEDLKVVLLDDWTISGYQLATACDSFLKRYPNMKDSIEIQLIAANEDRIKNGLVDDGFTSVGQRKKIPLKSYFLANPSAVAQYDAHITGFHSSVDFDFETTIANLTQKLRDQGEDVTMPPLTNIVRPYRADGITRDELKNIKRAKDAVRSKRFSEQLPEGMV